MKNKLVDLNDHLFAQIERLSDEDTTGEKLIEEIERSKAVGAVATKIIDNAKLVLEARKELDSSIRSLPVMLGDGSA